MSGASAAPQVHTEAAVCCWQLAAAGLLGRLRRLVQLVKVCWQPITGAAAIQGAAARRCSDCCWLAGGVRVSRLFAERVVALNLQRPAAVAFGGRGAGGERAGRGGVSLL